MSKLWLFTAFSLKFNCFSNNQKIMFKSETKIKGPQNIETIIGPSVKLEGDFEGSGDMVVDGIVIGNLKTKNYLKVGKDAKISANVEAQNAYIAGEISGNLNVKGDLEFTSSAKIGGDINCHSLTIERGALINGKISMNIPANAAEPTKPVNKNS